MIECSQPIIQTLKEKRIRKMDMDSMNIDINQLLFAASSALDAVEEEVLGATQNHARRVAYLSVKMGRELGMSPEDCNDLAVYAALHDNALTEYIVTQRRSGADIPVREIRDDFKFHCETGEQNLEVLPLGHRQEGIIRYHHENYDGSGLYGLKKEEIPLMSAIIHIADQVDVQFPLSVRTRENDVRINRYLQENAEHLFGTHLAEQFKKVFWASAPEEMADAYIASNLAGIIPDRKMMVSYSELIRISTLFAHIIDYKSPFTMNHSTGIAEKTRMLAGYYNFGHRMYNEVYIAAYLHDIGKLAVPNTLLEKPGRLTGREYEIVKKHAKRTHAILSGVDSFDRITLWASSHHERLDGSGYFRGTSGDSQDFCSRLLACVDMYQALVEDRPYRSGMRHDQAFRIMEREAKAGKLDRRITGDIGRLFRDI